MIIAQIEERERDRTEEFTAFARRRAAGEVMLPPILLPDVERRVYVRQTLREDHQHRIHNRPEGAQAKFDKLAKSPFTFFRGTALLYYRDYAGTDSHLPYVFVVGDVHPENFGVSSNEDGAPFFGVNDFDEACLAPFSWDLKRGGTGFNLAARENGFGRKARRKVVNALVDGYLQGLLEFARNDREKWHEYRTDNSPPLIRELIESVQVSRRDFLASMVDLQKGRFRPTDEIIPHSKHKSEFQRTIDEYRKSVDIAEESRGGHFQVKDVAVKTGSGTASLGLARYLTLIDGETEDPGDDLILELKQTRQSALFGLAPMPDDQRGSDSGPGTAGRIVYAHQIHLAGGDPYYGEVSMNGESYLVRERSPFKGKIDLDSLDLSGFAEYAGICGSVLAQVHARSDEDTGAMTGQAENQILQSILPDLFRTDVANFAEEAGDRVIRDYNLFRKDHAKGAFNFVNAVEQP